jgi:hypothetical protein
MSQIDNEDGGIDSTANAWYVPIDLTAISPANTPEPPSLSRVEQLHKLSLQLHQPDDDAFSVSATRPSSESNQRQFTRCSIVEDRASGVLTLNSRSFNCRLVELSIGGFGVVIAGQPSFKSGTVGTLRAPGLHYVVSVTRQEGRPGGAYIGLKQLEEIVDSQHPMDKTSPAVRYLIAGLSGALIAISAYYFMNGN